MLPGKVVGRSATDSQGTVTNYDSRGRVISRETTTGNTTTIYDQAVAMSDGSQPTAEGDQEGNPRRLCAGAACPVVL
jgi:YD repeat-containing protein